MRRCVLAGVLICALLTTQTLGHPTLLQAAAAGPESLEPAEKPGYVNPSHDEINQIITEVAREKGIPSLILKAIAFKESSWRQFDQGGNPLLSRPEHPAIGIMQIATYNDDDQETIEKLKTDIEFNIRLGADLLNEKWRFTPPIGDGDRNKLENWYFALWAYNIWTEQNNPHILAATSPATLTYQEKILAILAQPEGFLARYIEPVEITPLPPELLPPEGIPAKDSIWETPQPIHYGDLDSSGQVDGGSPAQPDNPPVPKAPEVPVIPDNSTPPSPPEFREFDRLDGKNRVETAVKQALAGWPAGAATVLLARADHFPDALAGVPLAAYYDAPILLTSGQALDAQVEEAIKILNPDQVVLLGGEGALSRGISAGLADLGWDGEGQIRLSGLNRYETAAQIALAATGLSRSPAAGSGESPLAGTNPAGSLEAVALATGENFPDALSIASIAGIKQMPILLTEAKVLPKETKEALSILNPQQVYLIGGAGAISPEIEDEIRAQLSLTAAQPVRLFGDSRYDTMAAVAEAFAGESRSLCFATGQEFPDALAGAALAARLKATVILLPQSSLEDYPRLKKAITQHSCDFTGQSYIFGGEGAVSPQQAEELKTLLRSAYLAGAL